MARERNSARYSSRGKIADELKQLNLKIDSVIKLTKEISCLQTEILRLLSKGTVADRSEEDTVVPDAMALLSLPSSLRKTVLALYKLGEATAEELSAETNRQRAVESGYANQLTRLGYVKKKREGRKVQFYVGNDTTRGVEPWEK